MIALIPLFPLIGFLINGIIYLVSASRSLGAHEHAGAGHHEHHASATVPGVIATVAIFAAFVVSALTFFDLRGMPEASRFVEQNLFTWIKAGDFSVDLAFRIDSLSTLFTLVITGVGTLIHVYSIGYMGHDATPGKFFAYLNLFCFAMLVLVMGSSLPIVFFGWEGVGLCSYLLIGYWYTDIEKAKAGKKAFVVNRIGDLGFLLGMFLIFTTFGTLEFTALREVVEKMGPSLSAGVLTSIALFLFIGCTGKSAQIPLFIWLPDAMAGPTPVSALIHAATMVTSGIYMLTRLSFLVELSPVAMMVIAVTGFEHMA